MLPRNPTLLEKMLLALGGTLVLLDLPMEFLTLYIDMPWINLFNDVKQVKFVYSEKATKSCEISTLLLSTVHTRQK